MPLPLFCPSYPFEFFYLQESHFLDLLQRGTFVLILLTILTVSPTPQSVFIPHFCPDLPSQFLNSLVFNFQVLSISFNFLPSFLLLCIAIPLRSTLNYIFIPPFSSISFWRFCLILVHRSPSTKTRKAFGLKPPQATPAPQESVVLQPTSCGRALKTHQ
jgi:hypothetical protein